MHSVIFLIEQILSGIEKGKTQTVLQKVREQSDITGTLHTEAARNEGKSLGSQTLGTMMASE